MLSNAFKNYPPVNTDMRTDIRPSSNPIVDPDFVKELDHHSLESVIEHKLKKFFDQLDEFYPENLYDIIMSKAEKPLISQILQRTGGNQVHASKFLGINRNTLRKKMKEYGLMD